MCIEKTFVWVPRAEGFEKMPKACGLCWRCRANRINDFAGRAMCEASVSDWTVKIELTYAPRADGRDQEIVVEDFQKAIRSMRKRGHITRYMVAGELGKKSTCRAHFHVILFGLGPKPRCWRHHSKIGRASQHIPHRQRCWVPWWPWGHVFATWQAGEKEMRYAAKYCMKDEDAWFMVSKKPVLGFEFLRRKAKRDAAAGLMPSSLEYLPPGAKSTTARKYVITGAARRDYLWWLGVYAKKPLDFVKNKITEHRNEWVSKAFDKAAKEDFRTYAADGDLEVRNRSPIKLEVPRIVDKFMVVSANGNDMLETERRVKLWLDGPVLVLAGLGGRAVLFNQRDPFLIAEIPGFHWSQRQRWALADLFQELKKTHPSQKVRSASYRRLLIPPWAYQKMDLVAVDPKQENLLLDWLSAKRKVDVTPAGRFVDHVLNVERAKVQKAMQGDLLNGIAEQDRQNGVSTARQCVGWRGGCGTPDDCNGHMCGRLE